MKKFLKISPIFLFMMLSSAISAETFLVKDIRVEGLQRITAGTVFNYFELKPGDTIDDKSSAALIRKLFKTGFFKDVRLERDGDVLVIIVDERPAISEISFSGNKSIPEEVLQKGLTDVGLASGRTFDRSVLDSIERELERQYFNQGKYAVKLDTVVTPLERNRVAIDISIIEGDTALIKSINIIGNKVFDEETLLDQFELTTGSWFSLFTKDNQYSKQKLNGDLESLKSYYLDRGFLKFALNSSQVTITPDKKYIYVTLNISENDIYLLSDIQLAGEYVGDAEDYFSKIQLTRGQPFSRRKVVESSTRISRMLADQGHAFANINAIPKINEEKKTVVITYFIDAGKKVYTRRINITGNSRTRDEVVRREFRQMEGAGFSREKLKLSKERAQRTGYFDRVTVATSAVDGSNDEIDINVEVVEKPSGALMAGVGFSQSSGVAFNASIRQNNFLGTGKKVALAFETDEANEHYEISYTNPYYTVDGISRGFTLSYETTDFDELDTADYKTNDGIIGMNFGLPLDEFNKFKFGLALHDIDFKLGSNPSTQITNWETNEGNNYFNVEGSIGWVHDSRDSATFPKEGALQKISAEFTLPGSDLTYYKMEYKHGRYFPLGGDLVLRINGQIGYGDSYGDTSSLPFFENYFLGGPSTVRGFSTFSLGPRDSQGEPLGGNTKILGNLELLYPAPFMPKSMRIAAFADAGAIYDSGSDIFDSDELRYSAGLGFQWLSPVGAIKFSYAAPFNKDSQDESEEFQFTFGSSF